MNIGRLQPADHLQAEHQGIHRELLGWLGRGDSEARSDDHLNILLCLLMLFDPESVEFLEDRAKVRSSRPIYHIIWKKVTEKTFCIYCTYKYNNTHNL